MKKIFIILLFPLLSLSQNSLLFSEYGEGSGFNKWVEIYNPTSYNISLDDYRYNFCWNGCDSLLWDFSIKFDSGHVIMSGETYLMTHFNADSILLILANQTTNLMSNGNDVIGLYNSSSNEVIDIIGVFDSISPSNGWNIDTVTNATKNHTIYRKSDVCYPNLGDWSISDGSVSSSEWIVSSEDNFSNLNTHFINCPTNSIEINNFLSSKELVKITDLFGRKINKYTKSYQIKFYIYNDGSVEKIIKIN